MLNDERSGLIKQNKHLFHYSEDLPEIKDKYMKLLRQLKFESYIIYIRKNETNKSYQDAYYKIFEKIFNILLNKYKWYKNNIITEENNKIHTKNLEEIIEKISSKYIEIKAEGKDEVILSMPDYILGVFRDCIKSDLSDRIKKLNDDETLIEERNFNKISDKIRYINDYSNKIHFSRKGNNFNCRKTNKYLYYDH